MAVRRILLFIAVLLLAAAVADAIVPRDEPPPAVKPPPRSGPPPDVVEGEMPGTVELRARVGDLVQLEVSHDAVDEARIVSLGIRVPVDPDLPAQIVFDADRPGRFSVTLRDARERLGVVEVLPAG